MIKKIVKGVTLVLLLFAGWTSFYQVDETQRVIIMKLGSEPLYEEPNAGLHGKLPWPYQTVRMLDKRLQRYDSEPREIITKDKKTMVVDTFSLFRIDNGIQFNRRLQTMATALARMDDVVYSELRNEMGNRDFTDILVKEREPIMVRANERTSQILPAYGITTTLVRFSRTDLPEQNKESVYGRMRSERERQAKEFRSLGLETAQQIKSETDKQVKTIVSEGQKVAEKTMGEGDAEATRIYNSAYSRNPKFFELYRGLLAAQKTLGGNSDVTIFLRGDEAHLKALFEK